MQPAAKQLKLNKEERIDLARRIQDDWSLDSIDMSMRAKAYKRWYQKWRAIAKETTFPSHDVSNFHIPLIQWQCLAKLAKEMDVLLGEDSEVVVRPIGESDAVRAPKIVRYMNWRVKISLRLFKSLYDYLLQKIVLGTTIGYLPWIRRERTIRKQITEDTVVQELSTDPISGLDTVIQKTVQVPKEVEQEVVDFEGPQLIVESIEDWAIPPDAKSLDEADHFARRLRLTVDELLDMADDNKLDKSVFDKANLEKLRRLAETGSAEQSQWDSGKEVREEKAEQQGLPSPGATEGRDEHLVVINWFGRYRRKEAKLEERAQDIVAYWQPDTMLLLGASRRVDLFPDGRIPFFKSELVRDIDSFWGIGLPEFLESINDEMDMQHNALTDAGVYALGPVIFYEPASGFNPEKFRYEPFMTHPVANADKVKVVNLSNINLAPYVALQSQLLGFSERISGLTEAELGRPFSQPNAPRTLGQQQILSAGSGVRQMLDLRLERESLREMLNRIWEMDKRFLPKPIFYRVTESEPGEFITDEEMQGDYDFDIGPLTGTANKAQDTAMLLQAYAMAGASPIAAQNPVLMSEFLKRVLTKLGQSELNRYIPDLSAMAPPESPEKENVRLLQGEDVDPHPQDNHIQHISKHEDLVRRLQESEVMEGVPIETLNPGVVGRIQAHIQEHQQAMSVGSTRIPPQAGSPQLGQGTALPSDQTGQPNDPLNALKSLLNQGGQNLA